MTLTASPEPATHTRCSGISGPRGGLALLSGLWLILFFASLFAPPVLDDADGTHANAARQMALSGDWVTLRVNNVRYLEKAPLPYWIVAASLRLFGVNTFAAHLPQALGVLLLMLLGVRWAREAFGDRAALYTGLGVLTSAGVFLFTRIFIPDLLLSLLLATALYCFLKSLAAPAPASPNTVILSGARNDQQPAVILSGARSDLQNAVILSGARSDQQNAVILSGARSAKSKDLREDGTPSTVRTSLPTTSAPQASEIWDAPPLTLYPYALWTTLALAVLTKGLVALFFLFGTAGLYLALTGEYRHWRRLRPLTGTLLMLAIAAPWHILAGLRNTGGMDGHGFFWFYFVNEHVLRFLGQRIPRDYNKLPGYLYWSLHLVWLFPWALFLGLAIAPIIRIYSAVFPKRLTTGGWIPQIILFLSVCAALRLRHALDLSVLTYFFVSYTVYFPLDLFWRRYKAHLPLTFPTLSTPARTTLLLALFSALVLLFFSLSTNQEYYTFPAYLPILMLLAAALARAELTTHNAQRTTVSFAHAAFTAVGLAISAALAYGLWTSRHIPFVPDIGDLLAHRGVGDYTLSMSALFDLTGPSFAALRLPAMLAMAAFAIGPAAAWILRHQRRHLAATTTIALTSAAFLIAAHLAFIRFAPMLSSQDMAAKIQRLEASGAVSHNNTLLLFGDQAYGSSIPFYLNRPLNRPALLVDGRSSSMLFGSTFPDAQTLFLTPADLLAQWGTGERKLLFVPLKYRDQVDQLLGPHQTILRETSGKALLTDRPLDH